MICTHAYAYPGEYEVVLIVNDTRGGSANASCIVTIREKEAPVQPPVPIRLAPPRITAPEDGAIVAGEVKIRGTAIATNDTGIIQQVDIRIGTEDADWLPAVDTSPTGNWSTWEYLWDTTKVPNGKYMIAARAFDGMNYSAITTINVTVFNRPVVTDEDYEEYEEGAEPSWWQRVIDAILANRIYLVGAFAVIILIVGLAVGFVVYKRRKRAKIPRVVGVPVPEQLLKPIPKRKLVPEKLLKPIVKVKRKLVQVRCPRCTKVFEIEDYGKRPLRMKCTRCGVRGMIRALPAELEEAERLKPIKKKKPKPPSPEIVTKRIKCPACTNVFTSELEAEGELVKCPECGRFGLI
jgi:ribosomal protein S27E